MAKEKKSAKAGRSSNSGSAKSYVANNRWWSNKVKKVKKHLRRQPTDSRTRKWLDGSSKVLDAKRGSPELKKLHEAVHA